MKPDATAPPVVAIVLGGGSGSRFGGNTPKQLADLGGKSVLAHALAAFDDTDLVDHVVVVANPEWRREIERVADQSIIEVEWSVVSGGAARNLSVANAVQSLGPAEHKILLHDGVRPLVSTELIRRVTLALDSSSCVIPVVPSIDPVVHLNGDRVVGFLPRVSVVRGQSPQGFWASHLRKLFDNPSETLDSRETVFELLLDLDPSTSIAAIDGDLDNVKVTVPIDRAIATALLQQRDQSRG